MTELLWSMSISLLSLLKYSFLNISCPLVPVNRLPIPGRGALRYSSPVACSFYKFNSCNTYSYH